MQESQTTVNHFGVLVEYLSEFPEGQLSALAERFGSSGEEPAAIARTWCQRPDAYLDVLDETIRDETAWSALFEIVYEHDAPIETDWLGMSVHNQLVDVGVLNELTTSPFHDRDIVLPGALAALVAPRLDDTRPSLPILLGQDTDERIRGLASEYDLSDSGSRIEVILRVMDFMSQPDNVERVLQRVSNPDWLGMAMMILELGGICYWKEVFGHDLDDDSDPVGDGGKVVPLMRKEERSQERYMADALIGLGIVFRVEPERSAHPMVAVPESLWGPMWNLGRQWLLDWLSQTHFGVKDRGIGATPDAFGPDLQRIGKWLVCESASGKVTLEDERVDSQSLGRLRSVASSEGVDLESAFENLFDLSVLRRGLDGFVTLGAEYKKLLDMPRPAFVENVLYEWCGGFLGSSLESHLPKAIGLDEEWREQAVEILRARHEFIPHWMEFEGVPQERTGAGCLRETANSTPEQLADELGIANGYVWSVKMIWLDLLSVLESERWYPLDGLVELMQFSASVCLFSQIGRLLDDPRAYFYIPVQRTSFLEDPVHTSEFEMWLEDVLDGLFVPLGIAQRRCEDDYLWLETEHLRVDTPPGWIEQDRKDLIAEVVGDHGDFELPSNRNTSLRTVSEPSESDSDVIPLDYPIDTILRAARGHKIETFHEDALSLV